MKHPVTGREMTKNAWNWYQFAVSKLDAKQVQLLEPAIEKARIRRNAMTIGGDHVVEAILESGLYQWFW